MTSFFEGKAHLVDKQGNILSQEEAVKRIKISAHKHGFLFRSRNLKDGTVKLSLKRKESM